MAASQGKLEITVNHCRNLPVNTDKSVLYYAKIEFAGRLLGESARIEVKEGETEANFNVTASLETSKSEQDDLSQIINNPLLVSVIELLPKDKKAKEEKVNIIGQVTIDLMPLLTGPTEVQGAHRLIAPNPPLQADQIEVDVILTVASPFVDKVEVNSSNQLKIKMDALYSVPSQWLPVGTGSFKFDTALGLPTSTDSPQAVLVSNGILRNNPSKEPESASTHWKWPQLATTNVKLACIPNSPIEPCALEDEDGELNEKETHSFRIKAQKDMPRVTWNTEKRSWLSAPSCSRLVEKLSLLSTVPLEVVRMTVPVPTGKGKGKEEDPVPSHHGVAYVDLSALLYPGVSRVRGAYRVHPYDESEFFAKGGNLPSYFAPIIAKAQSLLSVPTKGRGTSKRVGSVSKTSSVDNQESDPNVQASEVKDGSGEGQEYKEANSYIFIEISLEKPLVPRRPLEVLAQRVAEYIPPRPAVPRRLGGAEKSLLDYKNHISQVVNSLLAEYREMFGVIPSKDQDLRDIEDRKRKFLFHLNSSGKYHGIKESLKRTVVKVVRENFPGKSKSCQNSEELNLFIGELYTYLLDQMHDGLNQVLSLENPPPKPPSFTTTELLNLAAFEAEVYCDYALADQYHRQRLVEEDHMASHWYDYGRYSLHCKNYEKAEQCFKQSLSLDSSHLPSLLAYSMCCARDERYDEGETFLEMATQCEPDNALTWTISGLFYELCGKSTNQHRSFREAYTYGGYPGHKTFIACNPNQASSDTQPPSKHPLKNMSTLGQSLVHSVKTGAETQSHVSMATVTVKPETIVSTVFEDDQDLKNGKTDPLPDQETSSDSPSAVKKSLVDTSKVGPGSHSDQGNIPLSVSRMESVRSEEVSFNKDGGGITQMLSQENSTPASIFLTTAEFLLDLGILKFAEMSLGHELDSSDDDPSPAYHIARARYFIQQADYSQAENSIREAIKRNVQSPAAWSTLGHLHYLNGQLSDAQSAYERSLAFFTECPQVHSVHLRLGDIYLKSGQFKQAKDVFLLASCHCPSAVTWRGVGIACFRLNELENSFDALCEANILNNHDPVVWAYLTLVCCKTSRLAEAEQAYKFTLKADLQDSSLLHEVQDHMCTHSAHD